MRTIESIYKGSLLAAFIPWFNLWIDRLIQTRILFCFEMIFQLK